jgi:hypothetical protein
MAARSNSPNVVYGQHRSLALAERHRRALGPRWRIISSRNAQGRFSAHGHFFTFEKIKKKKKKPPTTEYQINVKYKPEKAAKVEVQISVRARRGLTRGQIEEAVQRRLDTGRDSRGFRSRIVHWERYGRQFFGTDEKAWNQLKFFFRNREGATNEEEEG